jgi:hypothetical protein
VVAVAGLTGGLAMPVRGLAMPVVWLNSLAVLAACVPLWRWKAAARTAADEAAVGAADEPGAGAAALRTIEP